MLPTDDRAPDDPLTGDEGLGDDDKHGPSFVPEFVRKMAWAGLGAVFMSEDGVRRLANQAKLPKEALAYLLSQAERTKDNLHRIVTEEVRKFLQSERLRDELLKLVAGMTIEVRAEVKLVPDRVRGEAPSLLPRVQVHEIKTRMGGDKEREKEKKGRRKSDPPPEKPEE